MCTQKLNWIKKKLFAQIAALQYEAHIDAVISSVCNSCAAKLQTSATLCELHDKYLHQMAPWNHLDVEKRW